MPTKTPWAVQVLIPRAQVLDRSSDVRYKDGGLFCKRSIRTSNMSFDSRVYLDVLSKGLLCVCF